MKEIVIKIYNKVENCEENIILKKWEWNLIIEKFRKNSSAIIEQKRSGNMYEIWIYLKFKLCRINKQKRPTVLGLLVHSKLFFLMD